jgi:hypothetical protein
MRQSDPVTDATIADLRDRLRDLIRADTQDRTDRAWFLAVYLSLATAWRLGFQQHEFFARDFAAQQAVFLEVLQEDASLSIYSTGALAAERRQWLAGHYYNNALLRIPPLAEVRLGLLWEKHHPGELVWKPNTQWSQKTWRELTDWYTTEFAERLDKLHAAKRQVDAFKHRPDPANRVLDFHTMADAISAFHELLSIAGRLLAP